MKKYIFVILLLFTINIKAETITISSKTTISDKTIEETRNESNNLIIDKGNLKIENSIINKKGNGSFNSSKNSAILVNNNSKLYTDDLKIYTFGDYAHGIYFNNNSESTIDNTNIKTNSKNSIGIINDGGKIVVNNTNIETVEHDSSGIYAISGEVEVNKSNITTNSVDSPLFQAASKIKVNESTLIANNAEGIIGIPSSEITLNKVNLESNNMLAKDTSFRSILLYNPNDEMFKGDIIFNATNSKINTKIGHTFVIMNAKVKINLENNEINNNNGVFLKTLNAENDDSFKNNIEINMTKQVVKGDIELDRNSTLIISLDNSEYNGAINPNSSAKEVNITITKDSKIKLTGNTYVTSLTNGDYENNNIDLNGYKLYINNEELSTKNIKRLDDKNDGIYIIFGLIIGFFLGFSVIYLLFRTKVLKNK